MVHAANQSQLRPCRRARGLSLTETVVSLAIVAILVGMSAAIISGGRRTRAQAMCASHLHSIGTAFNFYLSDNQDTYPYPTATAQWEELLRPYVSRAIFRCPADNELYAALGSSYDWRDTGIPGTTLAGVLAVRAVRGNASLSFDNFPGWHAPGKVQVLKVDMSQELMPQMDFFQDMQRSPLVP